MWLNPEHNLTDRLKTSDYTAPANKTQYTRADWRSPSSSYWYITTKEVAPVSK